MNDQEKVGLSRVIDLLNKLELSAYNMRGQDFQPDQINPSLQATSEYPHYVQLHQYLLGLIRRVRKEVYTNFPTDDNYQLEHASPQKLIALSKKYCYQDISSCPMCSAPMVKRNSKYGTFFGCKSFPKCRGSRKVDGQPAMTKELKAYLISKEKDKAPALNKNAEPFQPGRFADL